MTDNKNTKQLLDEIESTKTKFKTQQLNIREKINDFNCHEEIKYFLSKAAQYHMWEYSGNIQTLRELIQSKDLNLTNLNIGSKFNPEQCLKFKKCKRSNKCLQKGLEREVLRIKFGQKYPWLNIAYNQEKIITSIWNDC